MAKYLMIKADFNDADYSTSITKITDKQLESLKPGLAFLKKCKGKIEKYRETIDELEEAYMESEKEEDEKKFEELNALYEIFPWSGDNEIHTIVDIQLFEGTMKTLY